MTRRRAFRVLVAVCMLVGAYAARGVWPVAALLALMGVGTAVKSWTTSNN